MRPLALLAIGIFLTVPMAGCMDIFGDDYTPRTWEFELEVRQQQDTISLYRLNDGVRQMEVVAMGFTLPGAEELVVPNPEIRVKEGDTVILTVTNNNQLPHTLHLHGGLVPWEMDGVPFLNQMPIHGGESFTYTYENLKAGSYFYHCHVDVAHHMDLGMYGAFIVEEVTPEIKVDKEFVMMLDEWDNCHVHGNTDPVTGAENSGEFSNRADCVERFLQDNFAQNTLLATAINSDQTSPARDPACDSVEQLPVSPEELDPILRQLNCDGSHGATPAQQDERVWYPGGTFPVYSPVYNTFLINGKAFPDTKPLIVDEGDKIRVRLMNVGEELHAMHIHGHNFLVTHRDGYEIPAPFRADTLSIAPGERYDVVIDADNPGYWAFHDHIGLNVMNDDHSPGGMFTCMAYDDFHGRDASTFDTALSCYDEAVAILGEMGHGGH